MANRLYRFHFEFALKFIEVDETPTVTQAVAPRKVDIRGVATVAAFVDAKGVCLGAVPLELPVPGLTASIVEDLDVEVLEMTADERIPQIRSIRRREEVQRADEAAGRSTGRGGRSRDRSVRVDGAFRRRLDDPGRG